MKITVVGAGYVCLSLSVLPAALTSKMVNGIAIIDAKNIFLNFIKDLKQQLSLLEIILLKYFSLYL